jgi:hypothetical protein
MIFLLMWLVSHILSRMGMKSMSARIAAGGERKL